VQRQKERSVEMDDRMKRENALMHLSMSYELSEPSLTLTHKYLCDKFSGGSRNTQHRSLVDTHKYTL